MPIFSKFLILAFFFTSLNLSVLPNANAGCQDYPESITPECVATNLALEKLRQEAYEAAQSAKRIQEEQTARDNAAKDAADRAATTAADDALAPDDCARSTNRYLQSCIDAAVEEARIANEAIELIRKSLEIDELKMIADEKLKTNNCSLPENKALQVCLDSKIVKNEITKASVDLAKKIRDTQSSISKPLLNDEGKIILNAVLKSASLSNKDISNLLATQSLNLEDKNLIASYAQKLDGIKSLPSARSFKIPVSASLSEEFSSGTPKVCRVQSGLVKTLKPGVCILNVKFSTESGFEVETAKKIKIKK